MEIFNGGIFDDLEKGLKNLGEKIKENFNGSKDKKDPVQKCPNCGAVLEQNDQEKFVKCPYCSSELKNQNYSKSWFED